MIKYGMLRVRDETDKHEMRKATRAEVKYGVENIQQLKGKVHKHLFRRLCTKKNSYKCLFCNYNKVLF